MIDCQAMISFAILERMKIIITSILALGIIATLLIGPTNAQQEVCEEGDIACIVDQLPATDPTLLAETEQDDSVRIGLQMIIGIIGASVSAYAFYRVRKKHKNEAKASAKTKEDPLKKALSLDP